MAKGKRSSQQVEEVVGLLDSSDMARILLLFSGHQHSSAVASSDMLAAQERVFECKTCNRQFPSFQALGGHRASHKKPRLADGTTEQPKPKVHGCTICGLEFTVGQALGGHMRRHRAVMADVLGPKDDGKKTSPDELVLDLNVPALEEEPNRTRLGLAVEFPMAVDFPR